MTKSKRASILNKFRILGCALALPICATGVGLLTSNALATSADEFITGYSESVTVNNGSFQNGGGEYSTGYTLSGWEAVDRNSDAKGMIINVGQNFNDYRSVYKLDNNPRDTGNNDDRILMINSRSDENAENKFERQGYTLANNITLEPNSFYRLTVDAKASLDGKSDGVYSAYASIYLDGLKNADGKDIPVYYEAIDQSAWTSYYFFVATGNQSQSVNIGLYLGSKSIDSTGVVFFDEVNLTRFAQNTFYEVLNYPHYGYKNSDVLDGDNFDGQRVRTRFVIDSLRTNDSTVVDTSDLNFDFDDKITSTNTLAPNWKTVSPTNKSHAMIMQLKGMDDKRFKLETGYSYVGDDLTYDNKNALVLFNDTSSYITVESKPITIPAHAIYKISLKAKISSLDGNFFVGAVESRKTDENGNDISGLPSSYSAATFSKKGFTTNGTDNFHNGYTTVELYVKGHELFDSQFALQLSLGTKDEMAKGCVIFDNITITRVDWATYNSANSADKTEFKSYSSDPAFSNGNFDKTENQEANLVYPLAAQNWTIDQGDHAESGVVFVPADKEQYNKLYKPVYDGNDLVSGFDWYIASPSHPKGYSENNNVYMMFNSMQNYQTLSSPSFSIGSDLTEISFDLKTISTTSKDASVDLELVDENGITLLYRQGVMARDWKTIKLTIQGGESVSSNLTLKIHFGHQKSANYAENLMSGYVFLDNFATSTTVNLAGDQEPDVNLTDLYLNLDPYGTVGGSISDSSAYTFASENLDTAAIGQSSLGGTIRGTENEYGIESDGNLLAISTLAPSKNTLTSNFSFSLSGSSDTPNYYKLSFDLRTHFGYDELEDSKEHKCLSCVSVGLSDYNKTALRSDDQFTTYTIFYKITSSQTSKLVFTLDSDCDQTCGIAFLSNLAFEKTTEEDYAAAEEQDSKSETTLVATKSDTPEEQPETPSTPDETTTTINNEELWIIIPSLVMALAVVIAILAFALRKVKFKKNGKHKRENYDRTAYVNHDLMLKRAQEERDREAEEIRTAMQNLAQTRSDLENEHKEAVKASRMAGGKVTKATERQFKAYAQQIARLGEKEEILREQLETTMSADHLIAIEKRLADEEEKKLKEMTKQKPVNDDIQENSENKK